MADRAYIVSRTLEDKIAIAENNDQNVLFVTIDALKEILALLKEQEPKKIIRKQMSYEHPDGAITYYAEWHCPHCNKVVQNGFDSPWLKYCFNCGKPILWD